ncbi:hypothetical protein AAFC00_004010 [Neodothiora populina]|uniref:DUF625-domain-containing protein n=1 Tax=Neodothiora populina TaxID=2781224 RepID=A0ABR3PIH3_9PEZI
MMALATAPSNDRKRVKVYELKNNDWYDRGTGFCAGQLVGAGDEARVVVQSEDEPSRTLLETKISRDDGYQKQQDTLIVWTESTGVDMALSFQEADGCSQIWEFVSEAQQRLVAMHPDDGLSDDMIDNSNPILLPNPELGNLMEIENIMRSASSTAPGRDALAKFIMAGESLYIPKLLPLVEMAEDLEDIDDLHKLCNIMKTLILLNDASIIEFVVTDQAILGVVGALEYDPDFPSHKANHRQFLADESKFREVVKIENPEIKRKIHYIYRLQYLKDVVLARILDDPTFSVLNSMIFFHQVDIVNHIQSNAAFLTDLFQIFAPQQTDEQRKKDAVLFISNCSAIAKNIQAQSRAQLYHNLIQGGLLDVLTFALRHHDPAVRVAGSDVLVALIDHDPIMMRTYIFKAINEKTKPLTDTLIELLLVEVDLGVKAQMADAIKVLLDPNASSASMDMLGRTNGDFMAKMRGNPNIGAQMESFVDNFYDDAAQRLFKPLKDLEHRESLQHISVNEASLYTHLVEILSFFVRQHQYRSKYYILTENLHCRIAQLLSCGQKHLKLTALKWFRICIGLKDEYHNRQIIANHLFEPLLGLVYETMPRDNLLNSASLEFFEYIRKEHLKQLIVPLVENYREKLLGITYVNIFESLVDKYDQIQNGIEGDEASFSTQGADTPNKGLINGGQRWQGLRDADAEEEAYFNTSDGEDEDETSLPTTTVGKALSNGGTPARAPLVAYPDDDDETMDVLAASPSGPSAIQENKSPNAVESGSPRTTASGASPPDRLHEKRRRDEDDEDDLEKLAGSGVKRRNSASSVRSELSAADLDKDVGSPKDTKEQTPTLRRRGSLKSKDGGGVPQKAVSIGSISLSLKDSGSGEGS